MRPLRGVDDCAAQIEALYGASLCEEASVLHVTAVWSGCAGEPRTLRIGPETPRSVSDRFALGLARARVDAILTTGKILREEPALRHRYLDDPESEAALAAWRRTVLGRPTRPESVLLTSGRGIDWRHPLFHDGAAVTVVTGDEAAASLRANAPAGVRVVSSPRPSAREAVSLLRSEGCRVSVEAGATTAAELYGDDPAIDELMLSEFLGETLPEAAVGVPFAAIRTLPALFRQISTQERREPSGPWRFSRHRRR